MKNIFSIFSEDLKGIGKHFFVLVVTIGICVLPALYAWFNIYANWDPYANTSNIRLAAAITDTGWTDSDGTTYNIGEEVRKDLEASKSITWVFVVSDAAAQEGVRSGKYYAAISIGEDFSKSMFTKLAEKESLPELKYYLNGKKNAVATKVTDTAVESVQNSINQKYIALTTQRLFGNIQGQLSESDTQKAIQNFTVRLSGIKDNLDTYNTMVGTLAESNVKLSGIMQTTADALSGSSPLFDEGNGKLTTAASGISGVKTSFNDFSANVNTVLGEIKAKIETIASGISSAQMKTDAEAVKTAINELFPLITDLKGKVSVLSDIITSFDPEKIPFETAANELKNLQNLITLLEENATKVSAISAAEQLADSVNTSLNSIAEGIGQASNMFTNNLVPSMNQVIDSLESSLYSLSGVLTNLKATAGTFSSTLLQLKGAVDTLNAGLPELQETLNNISGKLSDLITEIDDAADSDKLKFIMAFLSEDEVALGNFFSAPVVIEDHMIFDIANYGSGVTPFYTALAIWVGMTILVSVLKVHPKEEKFFGAKRRELFFGRYLTFLLLSEIQTAIIVLGEIFIFKIQCLHPGLFALSAAFASLALSLIVYSLVVSFGDIGKAIAIIMLVLQIAGSGGTYPIEILPSFFRNVYLLFPFPYIINAMRECIGGMYDGTYVQCLLMLALFIAGALVLGLLVRLPLIPINKFVEERVEETKLM